MKAIQALLILTLASSLSARALEGNELTPSSLKQLAELTATDGTKLDRFGLAVAVNGNTVVVGAPYAQIGSNSAQGAAYVFVKPATGWANMTQVAKLTASDGTANLLFGCSVAISGNTIVVGSLSGNGTSSAYVFVMPATGWTDMTQTAELSGPGTFSAVSISGNVIVAGAQGAAFVFVKPQNGWVNTSKYKAELTASDGNPNAGFGWSVGISGNTIVVGAIYASIGSNCAQGAAYVFVRPATGWKTATQNAKLTASDGQSDDELGTAVAIQGSTIVAGAPRHTAPSVGGAAYVYVEPTGGWINITQTAELTTQAAGQLGTSVSVSSTQVVAGEEGGITNVPGSAFVYNKPATGWQSTSQVSQQLSASDGFVLDDFGVAVAISGGTIVVGAPKLLVNPGAAYVF